MRGTPSCFCFYTQLDPGTEYTLQRRRRRKRKQQKPAVLEPPLASASLHNETQAQNIHYKEEEEEDSKNQHVWNPFSLLLLYTTRPRHRIYITKKKKKKTQQKPAVLEPLFASASLHNQTQAQNARVYKLNSNILYTILSSTGMTKVAVRV